MKRLTTRGQATTRAIQEREEFVTSGSLRAECDTRGTWGQGELPADWRTEYLRERRQAQDAGRSGEFYTVYSYSTPIAWYNPITETWSEPLTKYSRTTSKHQGNLYGLGRVRHSL